jgi:hypothetical protein
MCHFCNEHDLEDAKTQVQIHGYEFLQPNAPIQYGVAWDGRIVAHTEHKSRAVQMAKEQANSQPGRWEPRQRRVGEWRDLEDD